MQSIENYNGILLVDKPLELSSFGVVARVRRASGVRKVGHAGTLDPMATGLLIVLVGKGWTKKADSFLKLDKSYDVELTLGSVSTTADSEGKVTKVSEERPTRAQINEVLESFLGTITQTPPVYSAVKIDGRRAYQLAREGKDITMPKREITISAITNVSYDYPKLRFSCDVSSGTYIRSLAVDIGEKLGTGAYLSALRRTRIGEFCLDDAITLESLI